MTDDSRFRCRECGAILTPMQDGLGCVGNYRAVRYRGRAIFVREVKAK